MKQTENGGWYMNAGWLPSYQPLSSHPFQELGRNLATTSVIYILSEVHWITTLHVALISEHRFFCHHVSFASPDCAIYLCVSVTGHYSMNRHLVQNYYFQLLVIENCRSQCIEIMFRKFYIEKCYKYFIP